MEGAGSRPSNNFTPLQPEQIQVPGLRRHYQHPRPTAKSMARGMKSSYAQISRPTANSMARPTNSSSALHRHIWSETLNILQMTRINQSKRDAFRPFWKGKMFTEEKDTAWEKIPDQREPKQGRVCALEKAMRNYVDRYSGQVVAPEIGREFDLLAEAFEFYNLYSWDIGFGIQYGQSRTNAHKSKIVQDIVCGCAGRPKKENTKSVACNCQALIRLHRN